MALRHTQGAVTKNLHYNAPADARGNQIRGHAVSQVMGPVVIISWLASEVPHGTAIAKQALAGDLSGAFDAIGPKISDVTTGIKNHLGEWPDAFLACHTTAPWHVGGSRIAVGRVDCRAYAGALGEIGGVGAGVRRLGSSPDSATHQRAGRSAFRPLRLGDWHGAAGTYRATHWGTAFVEWAASADPALLASRIQQLERERRLVALLLQERQELLVAAVLQAKRLGANSPRRYRSPGAPRKRGPGCRRSHRECYFAVSTAHHCGR
jgi:hypothetical protein